MILTEKNNKILELQCKHGVFASKLTHALSVGKCSKEMLSKNTFIAFNIDLLKRFTPFEDVITNAFKLDFKKIEEYENVDISIGINDGTSTTILATYSGGGTINNILYYLQNIINNGTINHGYKADINNNTLYIYSYNFSESFSYTTIINFEDEDDNDSIEITFESLENKTEELLSLWNCITFTTFEKLYKCLLNEYKINFSYLEGVEEEVFKEVEIRKQV